MPAPLPSPAHLTRSVGLRGLVLFGLAYMVPMTVFTTYGVVNVITKGHLVGAYVITLVAILFTAYSYGKMARAYPVAGSAYTYTQKSFGGHIGFLVGWSLLLDYLFLPMINYMIIGIYMANQFPSVPYWVWVVAAIGLITLVNIRGIQALNKINFLLVAYQVVFILIMVALTLSAPATDSFFTTGPFFGGDSATSDLFSGAAILCLSFLGFDAVTTLSEEAKDARRTIPKAIMLVALLGGLMFIFVSYIGYLAYPDYTQFTDVDAAALDVVGAVGGNWLNSMFIAGIVTGALASAGSSQAGVSRLLYAMGRDGALPKKVFAHLSERFHTPVRATIVVGIVALSALLFDLATVSSFISFGALIAFSAVNLSVITHYYIREKHRTGADTVRYLIVPGIGFAIVAYLWTSLSGTTFALGLTWAALGLCYLTYLTRGFRRPPPQLTFDDNLDAETLATIDR